MRHAQDTRPHGRRGVVAVAVALLSLALVLLGGGNAAQAGQVARTTGTAGVTGTVRGVNQAVGSTYDGPLAGAQVTVFDRTTGLVVGSGLTDTAGRYRVTGLPAVAVKLRITKPGWLHTYVGGGYGWGSATSYTLTAGAVRTFPEQRVYAEAAISGQVLSYMDPSVPFAPVTVWNAATHQPIRTVISDQQGEYRVGQLPPGDIKVSATAPGHFTGWANAAFTWDTAKTFTLKAGETLSQTWSPSPDLYIDIPPESVLTGTVLAINDGTEHPWDDPLAGIRITVFDAETKAQVGSTLTDEFGNYRVGMLLMGAYKVRADKAGWLTTWAHAAYSRAAADVFQLYPAEVVDVGSMTVFAPASVTGRVTGAHQPLAGVTVNVYDATTGGRLGTAVTDATGTYRIGSMPPAQVKIRAAKAGWVTQWANGRASRATADLFHLVAGVTLTESSDPATPHFDLVPAG